MPFEERDFNNEEVEIKGSAINPCELFTYCSLLYALFRWYLTV